jgi:hypothetical protein
MRKRIGYEKINKGHAQESMKRKKRERIGHMKVQEKKREKRKRKKDSPYPKKQ